MLEKDSVAIVSMACRIPSAPDIQSFWRLLTEGKDSFSTLQFDRFSQKGFKNSLRSVAFFDDIRKFDPSFFLISEEEAAQMDPQQRICLELAWETMANCGGAERYKNTSTGVFVGVTHGTYGDRLTQELLLEGEGNRFTTTGGLHNMVAARISHAFDLQGPALALDTACSSALVALHLAVQVLVNKECRQVLVGGVHLNVTAASLLAMESAGALTSNPQDYRIFDERSDGFFMGEGAGFVMLKRLDDALLDGDTILALLPGIATNNDGHSVSVMSPRPKLQREVITTAYEKNNIDRSKVVYVEAHGTGTPLGDAVEIRSLSQVFDDGKDRYIGSAKANIGHLLSAAGMAGLIKTILCLINRCIPPHINCEQERANLHLSKNHWIIPREPIYLSQTEPILMGVNSFGFGGTNVHLVLEEYPDHRVQQQNFKQFIPDYHKEDFWLPASSGENKIEVNIPPVYSFGLKPYCFPKIALENNTDERLLVVWEDGIEAPWEGSKVLNTQCLNALPRDIFLLFPQNWVSLHHWLLQHEHLLHSEQRLWIITQKAIQSENNPLEWNRQNAEMTAFCKIAKDELPCTTVQIDVMDIEDLSVICTNTIGHDLPEIPFLIYRNREWMQPVWEKIIIESNDDFDVLPKTVCLITGGMGGIGVSIAAKLLAKGATVILNGRSPEPSPTLWTTLLSISQKHQADLYYFSADCSLTTDVHHLMDKIMHQFGHLDIIFHAAGTVQPTAWGKLNSIQLETASKPKLDGLSLLYGASAEVGFTQIRWVIFSSISATLPDAGTGLSAYSMANATMQQYAVWMKNQGVAVISVAWGPRGGDGMSKNIVFQEKLAEKGFLSLSVQDVLIVLSCLINQNYFGQFMSLRLSNNQLPQRRSKEKKSFTTTKITENYSDIEHDLTLEQLIHGILVDVLEVKTHEIEPDTNLLDLGLDSLNAMDLAAQIEAKGFKNIPFELFFEHQTLRNIVAFLQDHQGEKPSTTPSDIEELTELPLSNLQQSFLKGHYLSQSPTFSLLKQTIEGTLHIEVFERVIKKLFHRHPMLRARVLRVRQANELVLQQYFVPVNQAIDEWKLEMILDSSDEDIFINRRFDLEHELPIRVCLRKNGSFYDVILLMHHAFSDGWSLLLLAQEIWQSYEKTIEGGAYNYPTADIAPLWNRVVSRRVDEEMTKWWQVHLNNYPIKTISPFLTEFFGMNTPWVKEPSAFFPIQLPQDLVAGVAAIAQKHSISLQSLYLSAYHQSLSTWMNEPNLLINCAVTGRHSEWGDDIYKTVGCFADAYPFYSSEKDCLSLAKNFEEWYKKVSHIPGLDSPTVIKWMQEKQIQQPLAGFSFVKFPIQWAKDLKYINIKSAGVRGYTFQTRFTLHCWDDPDGLQIAINYPKGVFEAKDLTRFQNCFFKALEIIVKDEKYTEIIADQEKRVSSVFEKIRQQSLCYPNKVAVQTESRQWTYRELLGASAQLAGGLLQRGFLPGNVLGWIGGHSEETIIALLASMRLGSTWLPIDRKLPPERAEWMIKQVKNGVLITESGLDGLEHYSTQHVSFKDVFQLNASADINVEVVSDHHAYIIFTSGSSGQPKGVPINMDALDNYLSWCVKTFGYKPQDRFVLTSSIGFDASMRQLLAPLLCGGQLHIFSTNMLRTPHLLLEALNLRKISVWSAVPSLCEVLVAALEASPTKTRPPLRIVHVGGERLSPELVARWQKIYGKKTTIYNLYGPTETTINATYFKIEKNWNPENEVPIGSAVSDAVLAVMDEHGNEVQNGELWIGGLSVTPGYLQETGERFVRKNGIRYYKTGDKVMRDDKGVLYFLGRMDRQIKWHGYRIEPAEIEFKILQIPEVKRAFVTLIEIDGVPKLVGALVTSTDTVSIEKKLGEDLPAYMVPVIWVCFEDFPLLENGKKDLQKLVFAIKEKLTDIQDLMPFDDILLSEKERKMAEIWSGILRKRILSKDFHFFNEGGDSIGAMLLFVTLEEKRWLPTLSVDVLYQHPTLADFTRHFDWPTDADETTYHPPALTDIPHYLPLTDPQLGFLYAAKKSIGAEHLWRVMMPIKGLLDPACFLKAIQAVFERHPPLRGKLEKNNGKFRFRIHALDEIPIDTYFKYMDWAMLQPATKASLLTTFLEKAANSNVLQIIDFPLFRTTLIHKGDMDFIWHVSVHHLLADGLSQRVFLHDFWYAYNNISKNETAFPQPLKTSVVDYLSKSTTARQKTALVALDYWSSTWSKPWIRPILPKNTAQKGFIYESCHFDKKQIEVAANLARTTPFVVVLYAYYLVLADWFVQEDIVVGIAQHGRDVNLPDIWNLFGNFAFAAPIRLQSIENIYKDLEDLAIQVRNTANFRLDVKALRKRIGYSIEPSQMLGSTFFMTWLPEMELPILPDGITVEIQQSETVFSPSEQETAIMLTVRPDQLGKYIFSFALNMGVFKQQETSLFVEKILDQCSKLCEILAPKKLVHIQHRPFSMAETRPIDAALIAYLPSLDHIKHLAGMGSQVSGLSPILKQRLFADKTCLWTEVQDTEYGRTGVFLLPYWPDEISMSNGEGLTQAIRRAADIAEDAGARCISLAGMLPAATLYGNQLKTLFSDSNIRVTTGHSTTVVAVIKTIIRATRFKGLSPTETNMAFIGLGSIGIAVLRTYLTLEPHPATILLCDVKGKDATLKALADTLYQEHGFNGKIHIHTGQDGLQTRLGCCNLIVGAAFGGEIIEVSAISPGTIVVDDSFPSCFNISLALQRMETKKDVLITGGGLLYVPKAAKKLYLPEGLEEFANLLSSSVLPETMASCQFESLLLARFPDLLPTFGLADYRQVLKYYEWMKDVDAAPFHVGGQFLDFL